MTTSAPYPIRLRRHGDHVIVEIDTGIPNKEGSSFVEKDAVMLIGLLVRACEKFDADPRIKKRALRARGWLGKYNQKHPARMLRDEAILSDTGGE